MEIENRVPERPPKPTNKSVKSVNETSSAVIKSSHPLRENHSATIPNESVPELKKPHHDEYDVPQTFSSGIQAKVSELSGVGTYVFDWCGQMRVFLYA